MMNKNILTIYDNDGNTKKYKILLVIKKEYNYIIYTDIDNENIRKNIRVIKVSNLNDLAILPINNDDWTIINNEYNKLIS